MTTLERRSAALAALFAVDLRSLALLRIGIATLILVDLADRAVFLRVHYTDTGLLPRADAARAQLEGQWSLHLMAGSTTGQAVLFGVAAVLAIALLVGWRTRWAAVASWILLVSLQARTPALSYGGDGVLRALLFYSMFLPVGARWSVDELRDIASQRALRADEHRSIPAAALILQIAIVYFFTGLLKLGDPSWLRLEAVFYALAGDHHATQLGLALSQFPAVTKSLTLVTLLLELVAPLFLFVPIGRARIRIALVIVFCTFHVVTGVTMHLGFFPWVSCLAWLALLPREAWERTGVTTRSGVDVESLRVGMRGRAVPHARSTLANAQRARGARARAALATAGVALAFLSSLDNALPQWTRPLPLVAIARAAALEQRWSMFTKPMHDGWFIVTALPMSPSSPMLSPLLPPSTYPPASDARAPEGAKEIDVLREGAPVSYERPAVIADQFKSMRWRKYFVDMTFERRSSLRNRRLFLRYICRAWNAAAEEGEHIARADLVFMQADDRPDGSQAPVQKRVLASRTCARDAPSDADSAPYFEQKPAPTAPTRDAPDDDDDAPTVDAPAVEGDDERDADAPDAGATP